MNAKVWGVSASRWCVCDCGRAACGFCQRVGQRAKWPIHVRWRGCAAWLPCGALARALPAQHGGAIMRERNGGVVAGNSRVHARQPMVQAG